MIQIKGCLRPYFAYLEGSEYRYPLPCGNCEYCRWKSSRVWSFRLSQELLSWNGKALYVTLTYNDENLPDGANLCPSHISGFFKRLRYYLKKFNTEIKFYACGEYGDRYGRPHYHAIIFGLTTEYIEIVRRCWKFGYIRKPSNVRGMECMNYVCGYVQKKIGSLATHKHEYGDREPFFARMSKGLGIGLIDRMPCFSPFVRDAKKRTMYIGRYLTKKLAEKFGVVDEYAKLTKQFFMDKWNDIWYSLGLPQAEQRYGSRMLMACEYAWYESAEARAYEQLICQHRRDFETRQRIFNISRSLDEKIKIQPIA
ncbi:MAG: replication initiator protein [Microviridae sp.]|nr:MAG: replication initiator protein [Microviridae sp.]